MSGADSIPELTINELFTAGNYIVPVYQRNYAWEEEQIEPLIMDIWGYAQKENGSEYFIGSLVVYQRDDKDQFELIDGQQRHTTLSILLAVLKNEFSQSIDSIQTTNLTFDSRKRAQRTLLALFANHELNEYEQSIKTAYDICKKKLATIVGTENIDKFANYLMKQVKILRISVPSDTDLNHYFEIMNNRGEQLEKHEVLKARLMGKLDAAEHATFAAIWDACSDMSRYVQYGFSKQSRFEIFGSDLNTPVFNFDEIHRAINIGGKRDDKSILECLKPEFVSAEGAAADKDLGSSDRFNSVVSFPNFILHALRIFMADEIRQNPDFDIPLDDKALLTVFDTAAIEPKQFVSHLLRLRFLFDGFVIKREWDDKWSLMKMKWYDNNENINYVNSYDDSANQQIILIQSMLHVSFPASIYKHWLNGILLHLHELQEIPEQQDYIEFLENYSDQLFFGRFSKQPLDYREIIYTVPAIKMELDTAFLNHGTNTQNFIFNRLDYLIWKVNTQTDSISDQLRLNSSMLNKFSFTFRSSVEHYYPQHPIGGEPYENCDRFGNLCLISSSNNSKLSNHLPTAKKEYYEKSNRIESLKQQLMMKTTEKWGPENVLVIDEHETAVVSLLSSQCCDISSAVAHNSTTME